MRYLFFDIECAGVYKDVAKICAFGYCLTDESFAVLEKRDLLINPQGRFHLTDRKGQNGLVLPYKYEDFKKFPTFQEYVGEITTLLQDEQTLVVGHAVGNDVKYLNLESKRFGLPSFAFSFVDTQFLYMHRVNDFSRQFGLGTIVQDLGIQFVAHRAVDDAYATMKIAETLCKEEHLSLPALIKKYGVVAGKIDDYEITLPTSKALETYKAEREKAKEKREKARADFHVFADREKRKRSKDGKLKNKRVCFSHALEIMPHATVLLKKAFAQGALFTYRAEECDLYVAVENESGARLQSAKAQNARIVTADEFSAFLGE